MNRQVVKLPVNAIGTCHAQRFCARQTTATHDMGADHFGQQGFHGQGIDGVPCLRPHRIRLSEFVHGQHLQGTCCKLDFHHREQGPAPAFHDVVAQGVVQHGRIVTPEFDLATRCVVMKTVAHERQQGVGVRKSLEQIVLAFANARHGGCENKRV